MPAPAISAVAVERPNIFAAPAPRPRHQPRRGGIFDDAARAESAHEAAPPSPRFRLPLRLSYLAPALLAIVAAVGVALMQERGARTEAVKTPAYRGAPGTQRP